MDDPLLDTAVSRALLLRVADGSLPATFRLHTPGRVMAFGRQDTVRPGYPDAVTAARREGFAPVERLAGGKAAVFHEETLAFAWATPEDKPRETIHDRFRLLADLMVDAFSSLGVDARVGEIPGEYCPGEYSVNAGGRRKIMGVGQRLTRTAAHVGGVVVVGQPDLVNRALDPVYDALGYDWDPSATGSLATERTTSIHEAADAVIGALADRVTLVEDDLDDATLDLARRLAPEHAPR